MTDQADVLEREDDEQRPDVEPRFRSVEEYETRQSSINEELSSLDREWEGRIMPSAQTQRWNDLNEELEENERVIAHISARSARLAQLRDRPQAQESGDASFHTRQRRGPSDLYDVWAIRQMASGPDDEMRMLRDNAMRAVERAEVAHPDAEESDAKGHIENLMRRFAQLDDGAPLGSMDGNVYNFARHILTTGSPLYRRAFGKAVMGRHMLPEEQRALATTTTAGGFAVPFTLDPTIIPTSNSSVNPYRSMARIETIATTTWQGVTSAGVTATRRSEAAQTADGAPVLSQPTATPSRVDAFVPYSIEVGQDWGSLEAEMARLIQDAKDDEEAASFTSGNGVAPNPLGIVSGATVVVTGATTASYSIADIYSLYNTLPPRFKPRAQWLANEAIYNLTRQFDTAGGAGLWIQNLQLGTGGQGVPRPGNIAATLLGRPVNEASAMSSATATGSLILVIGDFRYFLIVDRIGMTVDLIPHLFGTQQMPTGQRGLFAYWRNTSTVLSSNAFRVLKVR